MAELFLKVVNMSFSASFLALAVMAVRLLLKKAPKWVNVLLWGLVAFRLVCPFSIESAMSLIPSAEVVSPQIMTDPEPAIHTGIDSINLVVNSAISENFTPDPAVSANPLQIWIPILAVIWIIGMAAMGEYTLFTWLRLRRNVATAIRVNENVYLSDSIPSPFVLGVFRPKIYLPYGMTEQDMFHVIAHERTHIRRKDHLWKPLGFGLLTIHWFNPVLWVAYILLCRDIELACDEKVIKELGMEQRADYSQALLNCSVSHRSIAACPVAFGEVGVKQRVRNVLRYRKPAFWVIVIALVLCIVVAVCFLTDPQKTDSLEWLQNLSASEVSCVEFFSYDAAPDQQYALYEEETLLHQLIRMLNNFDGKKVKETDTQDLLGGSYTLVLTLKDGSTHTLVNHGNAYLQIDEDYFEDTHSLLNTWGFHGTTHLPGYDPDPASFYGVSLMIEEVTPNGATVVFTGAGEKPEGRLMGGNDYWLQRESDGQWSDVTKVPEPSFTTEAYDVDNIRRHKIDWQWRYGTLPAGHYRIGKNVTYQEGTKPMETATVWAEFALDNEASDAYAILANLIPDGARAEASFASGGGYNCFPDEAESLVQILNSIEESELVVSPSMNPIISINVYANEWIILHYNGAYVQFGFNTGESETPWAVKNEKLNAFFERLNSLSPENSTYEIYNVAPLEDLPEHYSIEEATIDKVVIQIDGDISANQDVWQEFVTAATSGIPATVRVMHYYFPTAPDQAAFKTIYDLTYDGEDYTLYQVWDGIPNVDRYKYLQYFLVEADESAAYDSAEYYCLSNVQGSTYENLKNASTHDAYTICTNLIYVPKEPDLPWTSKLELRINGLPLVTLSGYDQVHDLWYLLDSAQYLGYEPKTYNLGPDIVLIGDNGNTATLNLDMENDLFRYKGCFYDYGPGTNSNGGISNMPKLWGLLGLEGWPDAVKKAYPDFFAAINDAAIPPANTHFPTSEYWETARMDLWYPDWSYLEIPYPQTLSILEPLYYEAPNPSDREIPPVEESIFTLHIAFNSGQEFDLCYVGQDDFFLRVFETDTVYTFSSNALHQALDNAISDARSFGNK